MGKVTLNKTSISFKFGKATLNKKSISFKFGKAINKRSPELIDKMNTKLQPRVNNLLKFIRDHKISKEIDAGPNLEQSSILPYGNLFSFLGFHASDQPIDTISEFIHKKIRITDAKVKSVNFFVITNVEYKLNLPKISELEAITKLPWDKKRSWLRGIEITGYDNFAHYLYEQDQKFKNSRSGPAIQVKPQLRDIQNLAPQPYILSEIEKFIEQLKNKK